MFRVLSLTTALLSMLFALTNMMKSEGGFLLLFNQKNQRRPAYSRARCTQRTILATIDPCRVFCLLLSYGVQLYPGVSHQKVEEVVSGSEKEGFGFRRPSKMLQCSATWVAFVVAAIALCIPKETTAFWADDDDDYSYSYYRPSSYSSYSRPSPPSYSSYRSSYSYNDDNYYNYYDDDGYMDRVYGGTIPAGIILCCCVCCASNYCGQGSDSDNEVCV